ncbi:hypothetical protein [Lacipirellula sp.]|uniref:hypothetical protein n=1 Tax=Lacipirellula sp. TaxID=2691419 RepID=UPI003D0B2525
MAGEPPKTFVAENARASAGVVLLERPVRFVEGKIVDEVTWAQAGKPVTLRQQPPEPSLARKAFNYGKAIVHHLAAGKPLATDEQVASRHRVCQSNLCGLYKPLAETHGVCCHPSCGCPSKAVGVMGRNKLRLADQECPATNPETGQRFWERVDSPAPPPAV